MHFRRSFSQSLKIAEVVPISKAGEKNLASNYRRISLSGILSNVFEKVIHERLMTYLENFSLLSENQYGFRKKKMFIQAATSLYKNIGAKEFAHGFERQVPQP